MKALRRSIGNGFTLVELMIVVAVIAVIAILAAPSFTDFILLQRLKSVNSQFTTDLQFARAEAATRGVPVYVRIRPVQAGATCYIVFADSAATIPSKRCDCHLPAGARCTGSTARELKSVVLPTARGVRIALGPDARPEVAFDPVNGALVFLIGDGRDPPPTGMPFRVEIDSARRFETRVTLGGRPSVCVPAGSNMAGVSCSAL